MTGHPDPTELRHVEKADVYKAGRLAGHLHRERDDVLFTYAESYLADPATAPDRTMDRSGRHNRLRRQDHTHHLAAMLTERSKELRRSHS
ncbi:hypothetical protein [Nocardia jiangxiensis]|uniref:Uncharacterized protein n=1 Tax=Nocardia jiangxiensis TaxID=282685 RepID=A0ABW6SGD7_9NOCA|nr:hypothetical protein [Nocardia jiangxiensis]